MAGGEDSPVLAHTPADGDIDAVLDVKVVYQQRHDTIDIGGHEIHANDWQRGSRLQRLINWAAYGLVRLMIGIAGYGNRH